MATKQYDMTNGPSKYDLMVALFSGQYVEFTLKSEFGIEFPRTVRISSVEIADGNSQSWNLKGWITIAEENGSSDYPIKAYYSSRSRKGWFKAGQMLVEEAAI